ncbi:2-(1,2-epoxy-1,2-dihydrophenyl)acetyl-CoA isomerase PaaG [Marinospirillum alkaliphilum]|uniref:2-(1,2-epoxy-1,2-dihydrophenyl)acetyl-CoA isomerase n=1 Tax=Marinospirillum alkaliphilum DSM 21637 TaxID=1122209 RepID=A0A1K1TBA2_9GAMM|nr:2-(1,2-epoxy-1,2-dihydrophenyl)acetyl-CoA isomerase PaaG [Marinospirillum alkaliphilum]SFW97824.1 2-(1,2-epoxy-1,2-dihydrophenyl)acetyl-CoA isomerase [Marinospirillum alkaliphilum DSM 21637]
MSQPSILLEIDQGVALLTLNRPDSLNSFNAEMHDQMRAALSQVRKDASVRVLVITGAGRGFCAGQDLSDRNVAPGAEVPDLGESIEKRYNPMIRTLRDLPLPVICAVNGVAAGAGANIALACDITLAARSASFIQAFCKIGLIPDSGGTWTLPRLAGMARAKGMALLGDKISAEQAESWGMIWRCVDNEQLMDETMKLARHLATQPTKGLALIKRALHASASNSFDEQLDLERDLQRLAGRTEDYREGVAAFMEKRQPNFKGQ